MIGAPVDGGVFISDEELARFCDGNLRHARRNLRLAMIDAREPRAVRGPTAKPDDVRIAQVKDEHPVFDLVMKDLEENARIAPINRDKVANLIMMGTRRRGGIVGVIDGPDGAPVAVQVIAMEQWWWSEQVFLMKMLDYVHPDHRHTTHAAHLVQFSKWCSDFMTEKFGHRVYLLSGVLGTQRVKDKLRMYTRHLTQVGGTFLYPYPETWETE